MRAVLAIWRNSTFADVLPQPHKTQGRSESDASLILCMFAGKQAGMRRPHNGRDSERGDVSATTANALSLGSELLKARVAFCPPQTTPAGTSGSTPPPPLPTDPPSSRLVSSTSYSFFLHRTPPRLWHFLAKEIHN